jgi:hypothetical protein
VTPPLTEEEHAARIARIRKERAAAGLPPYIESEAVYRLLAAIIDANRAVNPAERRIPPARYSTRGDAPKS